MTYAVNEDQITIFDTATGNAVCVCGVPDGFVLVPKELTGEMWSAGRRAFVPCRTRIYNAKTTDEAFALDDVAPMEIYRATLSAAPPPPTFPDEQVQRTYAVLIAHLLNEGAK